MAGPRRKVVSAKQLYGHGWSNRWVCVLAACGHTVHVDGRHPEYPKLMHEPPKTASCWRCEDAQNKASGNEA